MTGVAELIHFHPLMTNYHLNSTTKKPNSHEFGFFNRDMISNLGGDRKYKEEQGITILGEEDRSHMQSVP